MSVDVVQPRPDRLAPLRELFADRRLGAMTVLGFSSGIPFLLVYITQAAWLSEAKVPIGTLGLMSEMTLAYKFKWVWAPFLDRYDPPWLGRLLGRRRGWIVMAQIGVMVTLAGIAFGDPAHRLAWTVWFSLALGFAGATQDVVIDGWRITVAPVERQALMSSWSEVGWRVGNLVAGAGALYLADGFGWRAAYLVMALCMTPGMIAAWMAPEPPADTLLSPPSPRPVGEPVRAGRRRPWVTGLLLAFAGLFIVSFQTAHHSVWMGLVALALLGTTILRDIRFEGGWPRITWIRPSETIAAPIRDLFVRLGPMAIPTLLLVAGFRMPGYISSAMAVPLFKSLHYSNSDIATVTKLFGFPVAIAGTFTATYVVKRIGLMPAMLVGTVFASASHLSLAYLAVHGDHGGGEFWLFATSVSIDDFAYAFASIILITYMSALSSTAFAATQYALLTSLCALPGSLLGGASGFLIERMSFEWFFVMTSLIGVPVALLCWWMWRRHKEPVLQPS